MPKKRDYLDKLIPEEVFFDRHNTLSDFELKPFRDALPCTRLGDQRFYDPDEIDRWIRANLSTFEGAAVFQDFDDPAAPDSIPPELEDVGPYLKRVRSVDRRGAVYFLIKSGKVVYVGQSVQVETRVQAHAKDKDFDEVLAIFVSTNAMTRIENRFIERLRPPLNRWVPRVVGDDDTDQVEREDREATEALDEALRNA